MHDTWIRFVPVFADWPSRQVVAYCSCYLCLTPQVISAVENNATLEFEYIYDEIQNGRRSTEVTRQLSEEMNGLNDMITKSDLYESEALRREVGCTTVHPPCSLLANVFDFVHLLFTPCISLPLGFSLGATAINPKNFAGYCWI